MKEKVLKLKSFLKKVFTKKRYIALTVIIILVIFMIVSGGKDNTDGLIETVTRQDVKKTVLASGEVTSLTDLNLGFNDTGVVEELKVKVGDNVKKGQLLATLKRSAELADLTSAQGSLLSAEVSYKKALGSLETAKSNLENIKREQAVLVANAYRALLSTDLEAVPESTGSDEGEAPIVTGTYNSNEKGEYLLDMYASSATSGYSFRVSGLETGSGSVTTNSASPIGVRGLYVKWPEGFEGNVTWVITIPNIRSSSYVSNLNAYNLALETQKNEIERAERVVAEREAEFGTNASIESQMAFAEVVSARGKVQAAQARVEDKVLRAPSDGTITSIAIDVGELVEAHTNSITIQDVGNLYLKAKVNEENIRYLRAGQNATVIFDAFGNNKMVTATIAEIDLSATKEGDVVNYEITATLEDSTDIKAGMTATMTVLIDEKKGVLAVPLRAVARDGTSASVSVLVDEKKMKSEKRSVVIGLEGDGSMVEIVSGLSEGEQVLTGEIK